MTVSGETAAILGSALGVVITLGSMIWKAAHGLFAELGSIKVAMVEARTENQVALARLDERVAGIEDTITPRSRRAPTAPVTY